MTQRRVGHARMRQLAEILLGWPLCLKGMLTGGTNGFAQHIAITTLIIIIIIIITRRQVGSRLR